MWKVDSLEKTDAGKDWGQEEEETTEDEMARCITDLMDMSLSELREMVMDREAWHAAIHGITKSRTPLSNWTDLNWWVSRKCLGLMNAEEGLQRLKQIGMLEWICHLRPISLLWNGPEDTPFTSTVRNKFVKGVPDSLKSFVITLLCRPDLTGRTAIAELGNLNATGITGSQSGRGQVVAPTAKGRWALLP